MLVKTEFGVYINSLGQHIHFWTRLTTPQGRKHKSIIFSGTRRSVEQREWRTSLLLNILSDSIVIIVVITVNYYTLDNSCLKIVKCSR